MLGMHKLLMRMFGRPKGVLGRLGGVIMARVNRDAAAQVIEMPDIRPDDKVLEVGFGPGVAIQMLLQRVPAGSVAGVDQSQEMVRQAAARNADALRSRRADLRYGSVERLPFADETFDKALAINSMQAWPDARAGLREIRRVLKHGGPHRRKRPRKPCIGMMLHQDASPFAWLEGAGDLDLVVTLDDATGEIYSAFLVEEEGTVSTLRALLRCSPPRACHRASTPTAAVTIFRAGASTASKPAAALQPEADK